RRLVRNFNRPVSTPAADSPARDRRGPSCRPLSEHRYLGSGGSSRPDHRPSRSGNRRCFGFRASCRDIAYIVLTSAGHSCRNRDRAVRDRGYPPACEAKCVRRLKLLPSLLAFLHYHPLVPFLTKGFQV